MEKKRPLKTAFLIILRLILGGVFVLAAVFKIKDPTQFLNAIESFQVIPFRLAYFTAFFLPWLELWAGLALILQRAYSGALVLLALLMVFFIALLSLSWARGLDVNCGCFGDLFAEKATYPKLLLRNSLMLAGLIGLIVADGLRPSRN